MSTTGSSIVLELPQPAIDLEQQCRDLDRYGLCLVPDALSARELSAARTRVDQQASGELEAELAYRDGGSDQPNQRIWNLVSKGQVFRDMVVKPLVSDTIGHVLGGDFLLSSFTANIARRGGEAMRLHTDQGFAPLETPYALAANIMWMLDDFTEENGGTRVVPGSHLTMAVPDPQRRPDTVAAVGPAGTAMVFDARIWHGTGSNLTDAPRRGALSYFCRPFVRTQENHTISTAPAVLAAASPELKRLLGFHPWRSLGGRQGPYGVGPGPALGSMTGDRRFGSNPDWYPEVDLSTDLIGELD